MPSLADMMGGVVTCDFETNDYIYVLATNVNIYIYYVIINLYYFNSK